MWYACINYDKSEKEAAMQPIPLKEGDLLLMKKNHPCGGDLFKVLRVGSDLRVVCCGCGRDMTLPRMKLEPHIKKVNP